MSTIQPNSIVHGYESVGYPTLINAHHRIEPGGTDFGAVGNPTVTNGGAFNQTLNPTGFTSTSFGSPSITVPPGVVIDAMDFVGSGGSTIVFAELDPTPPAVDIDFVYLIAPAANIEAMSQQFDNLLQIALVSSAPRIQAGCTVDLEVIAPEDIYDFSLTNPPMQAEICVETDRPSRFAESELVGPSAFVSMEVVHEPPIIEIAEVDLIANAGVSEAAAVMSIDWDFDVFDVAANPGNIEAAIEVFRNFTIETTLRPNPGNVTFDVSLEQELDLNLALAFSPGQISGSGAARATLYSPFVGRIAVDQPQGGTYYPFYAEPEEPLLLENVYDLYVSYEPGNCTWQLPLALVYIGGLNNDADPGTVPSGFSAVRNKYDIVLIDALGNRVIETYLPKWSAKTRLWGSRFDVIEWVSEDAVVRMVRKVSFLSDAEEVEYPNYLDLSETPAMLQPRTVVASAARVQSLQVYEDEAVTRNTRAVLNLGMNMVPTLESAQTVGVRTTTRVVFNADALEEFNPCDDPLVSDRTQVVRSINGIAPNEVGAFMLSGDGCYRIQRPTVVVEGETVLVVPGNEITINQDNCVPCCDCDDYVGAHRAQENILDRIVEASKRIERARDLLYSINHRIATKAAELRSNPVTLTLEAACPGIFKIAAILCNFESCAISDVYLDLTMNNYSGLDRAYIDYNTVVANNGLCVDMEPTVIPNQQNWPQSTAILTYRWDKVAGNGNAAIRLVVRSKGSQEGEFQVVVRFYVRRLVNGAFQEFPLGSVNKTVDILYPDPITGRCGDNQLDTGCE